MATSTDDAASRGQRPTPNEEAAPTRARRTAKPKPIPPTVVLFVRHGATPTTGQVLPGRAPGLHLSEAGLAQAQAVAERLGAWRDHVAAAATDGKGAGSRRRGAPSAPPQPLIAAVFASPLERTAETAAPIAKRLGLPVRRERHLIECDFGEWTGAKLADLAKLPAWSTVQRYPSGFRFPDGESFLEVQSRMVEITSTWRQRFPGQTIIAVSHADPIKTAVAHALGTHLDLFQRIAISPCSVTAIAYTPTGPMVLTTNSTSSLQELRPS